MFNPRYFKYDIGGIESINYDDAVYKLLVFNHKTHKECGVILISKDRKMLGFSLCRDEDMYIFDEEKGIELAKKNYSGFKLIEPSSFKYFRIIAINFVNLIDNFRIDYKLNILDIHKETNFYFEIVNRFNNHYYICLNRPYVISCLKYYKKQQKEHIINDTIPTMETGNKTTSFEII
jgi:hypothetical protein